MTGERVDFEAAVREAYGRIAADIRRTPLEYSEPLSRETGARVYVKWECDQTTGSFKLRGALNKLRSLSDADRDRGVVSASTGNHGLAISHASRLEGIGLKLFLPTTVAEVKRKRIEALGVDVEIRGASCDKAESIAREFAGQAGRVFVSPYNDWDIVFGAGTVGLELAEDLSRFEDVLVPVGGGGLIAGIAGFIKAAKPETRIIGVEPETSAFMAASIAAGRLIEIDEKETIADAVAGGIEPGAITFPLCRDLLDFIEEVPESLISRAMAFVHEHHGRMVEGAGALPLAALLHSPAKWRDRTVVAVVSGGNVSPERFRAIVGPA
ncbi:MAG TPA: pyridoxal-phosphate dependent enzyme [Candidatus Latescibacteria bacterium]|nr:pyridoxal-phosphate dependent enzyme [Candidatus Latescibacterota bacterium]